MSAVHITPAQAAVLRCLDETPRTVAALVMSAGCNRRACRWTLHRLERLRLAVCTTALAERRGGVEGRWLRGPAAPPGVAPRQGLTGRLQRALEVLRAYPGPLTARELAEQMGTTAPNATGFLLRLLRLGLIRRWQGERTARGLRGGVNLLVYAVEDGETHDGSATAPAPPADCPVPGDRLTSWCRWCGDPLPTTGVEADRFCDDDCRCQHALDVKEWNELRGMRRKANRCNG